MQSIIEQIFIGVLSGVITTVAIYFCVMLFNKALLPWYKRFVYEGVDLSGTWEYRHDEPNDFGSMVLGISQNAHELEGDANVTVRKNGDEVNFIYSVKGTLWEGYASLTLKSKDRRVIAFSTLLLKVVGNGEELHGVFAFKHPVRDIPDTAVLSLKRKT